MKYVDILSVVEKHDGSKWYNVSTQLASETVQQAVSRERSRLAYAARAGHIKKGVVYRVAPAGELDEFVGRQVGSFIQSHCE